MPVCFKIGLFSIVFFTQLEASTYNNQNQCRAHNFQRFKDTVPCSIPNITGAVSSCCEPGAACLSNGLCVPQYLSKDESDNTVDFQWQGCTDPAMKDPLCLPNCTTILGEVGTTGVRVCTEQGANHYCCFGFNGCFCEPSEVFTLPAATVLTTILATATSSNPIFKNSSDSMKAKSLAGKIPLAVGVGLSVPAGLALTALAIFYHQRRRLRREARESREAPEPTVLTD